MIEDEKIIELFFERSEQGIRELDIKYGKVCHKLSNNIVNNRQDAEECVNDAYLGAWNAIPPAHPNPLLTYICKIVRNISLKIYYKKEASKRSSHYTIAMEEIEACIADPNTVEAEIEARELARIIESFLDTLTVENRVIFMRRYWFSDSCKDIAGFVGLFGGWKPCDPRSALRCCNQQTVPQGWNLRAGQYRNRQGLPLYYYVVYSKSVHSTCIIIT